MVLQEKSGDQQNQFFLSQRLTSPHSALVGRRRGSVSLTHTHLDNKITFTWTLHPTSIKTSFQHRNSHTFCLQLNAAIYPLIWPNCIYCGSGTMLHVWRCTIKLYWACYNNSLYITAVCRGLPTQSPALKSGPHSAVRVAPVELWP